jgi:MFS family permease
MPRSLASSSWQIPQPLNPDLRGIPSLSFPPPRYYPVVALQGISSSFSLALTCVADMMRPEHRAASAAFILAMFSVGLIIGPVLGGLMSQMAAGGQRQEAGGVAASGIGR